MKEKAPYFLTGIGIDDTPLTWCPRKYADQEVYSWLMAYADYKNGFLPNAGGTMDQPMKFGQVIATIESAMARMDEKQNGG